MIESSFIILDKVSHKTEQFIWDSGITDWNKFIEAKEVPKISQFRKFNCDRFLKKAKTELYSQNSEFFKSCLPNSEVWRLYNFFKEDVVYLDIETTGYYGDITVVGLYNGLNTKIMVKGINLNPEALKQYLKQFKLLVTFNGLSFDVPVLEKYFPGVIPKIPHLDLRYAAKKVGLEGGLKNIEKILGIQRPEELNEMHGSDAIYLWNMFKSTGNRDYLQKLIMYNEEDIINLKKISEIVTKKLSTCLFQQSNI